MSAGSAYGVLAYSITQRTRELGLRQALGEAVLFGLSGRDPVVFGARRTCSRP